MSKEGLPSEVAPLRPRIARENVQEYLSLSLKPKAETLEKRNLLHKKLAANARIEAVVHTAEMEMVEKKTDLALGLREPRNEFRFLSEKELTGLQSSIYGYNKDKKVDTDAKDLDEAFMGSLKNQENYKAHYQRWEIEYQQKSQKDSKFAEKTTFDDYIRECGIAFIKANARLIMRKGSQDFYDSNIPKNENGSVKESQEKRYKFSKAVDVFVDANNIDLTGYSGLTPEERDALLQKFTVVLTAQGFDKLTKPQIVKFLEELAGHMEYQYLAILEYEGTCKEMSAMAKLDLTPEQWEERRQRALKKNAIYELQETLQQPKVPVYAPAGPEKPTSSFVSVQEVANTSGVHLTPEPGKGKNVYSVDFPVLKDSKFRPLVRIVYPKGVTDINKAKFLIEEFGADPDAHLAKPIGEDRKDGTKEYKPADVLLAMNRLILNYVLKKRLNLVIPANTKETPDTVFRNDMRVHFAERLLGFQLTDKRLLETNVTDYEKFLVVLMRADGKTSLDDRVKQAGVVLDEDGLLPYVRDALKAEGSTAKTFGTIVEEAKLLRAGMVAKAAGKEKEKK
jgi:hypothetical protein